LNNQDTEWIDQRMAAAKPLADNRDVRLIVIEDYADALRLCRILSLRSSDGTPLHQDIADNLEPGDARFLSGLCGRGETAGALACAFFRDNRDGARHARAYFFFGPREELEFMRVKADAIHQT
jgi:hypothetical protein